MKLNGLYISKSFLETGQDLVVTNFLSVKHPTLGDILDLGSPIAVNKIFLGENVYWMYVYSLICDPYYNMVMLDDLGYDYEEVSSFDVFCIKWKASLDDYNQNKDIYDNQGIHPLDLTRQALNFFLGNHDFELNEYTDENGELKNFLIDKNNPNCYIDDTIFLLISTFIQAINGIKYEDKINPKDKNAKRILIEDMRDEEKHSSSNKNKDEDNDYIGSLLTGCLHGANSNIGENLFDIKKLKIFSIYSHYITRQKKDAYDSSVIGAYCGMGKMEKSIMNWMI